ncbi:MAG TPA: hypothetical protein PKN70_14060 [Smithellaceae bacterium]|nr:hypothetical protein [Smithellaceae bacterium]
MFFLDKPNENKTGKHPNDTFRIENSVVFVVSHIIGKGNILNRPEIPVGQFAVKALVEFLGVERFLPGLVQFDKVGEFVNALQFIQRQIKKDFKMGAMRTGDGNIFNQRDFFKDILLRIPLMQAAINNGKRQRLAMPEDNHDRHGEDFVYFAGYLRQICARIFRLCQFDGEEKIGFNNSFFIFAYPVDFIGIEQALLAG